MPTRTFTQTFAVATDPATLRSFLLDPHSFPKIHPLIASVTVERERQEGGERVTEFVAIEHVPLLGFTLRNRLRCEAFDDPGQPEFVRAVARVDPGVIVDSTYTIEAAPGGCSAAQVLTLTAPWGTMGFVYRTAVAAHTRQAAAIQAHFA